MGKDNDVIELTTAEHRHIRAICLLSRQLYEEMAILRPDYYTAGSADEKKVQSAIDDNRQEIFVALDHNAVVGFVRIAEREKQAIGPYFSQKYAYIAEIAVDPAFRGIDIGTGLIAEAKKWAKSRSLNYIEIRILDESPDVVSLYKRENFEPVMQTMRCAI